MSGDAVVKVKNDSERLKKELTALLTKNKDLHDLIFDLAEYIKETFKKDLVITMIDRTQDEQDEIYKDDAKYKVKKFTSPHMYAHAIDLRSLIFTKDEIKKIEDYLNNKYNPTNYYKWTARDHKVGIGASHFHVQYVKRG